LSKKASDKTHFEGEFLYPIGGIQRISEKLVTAIGSNRVLTEKRITGIHCNQHTITAIEINNSEAVDVDTVISTLPLPSLIAMLKHPVPEDVSRVSASLRFRNIRLAAFSLNSASVNSCATMYFPEEKYLFTRIYEPKNRYIGMSPEGKTMIVAEVPCFTGDDIWQSNEEEFNETIKKQILEAGIIKESEIISSHSEKLENAYPVLEKGYAEKIKPVIDYLSSYNNLHLSGRNALFRYSWIHDMFIEGRLLAENIGSKRGRYS
jgi:protoporphyrinogen oxidase